MMKLFYHEIGRSVEFKYCFDLRLDETQPEKPSIGAKSTSESNQCLLTLDFAVITQYNYTAITLDFVLQVFIRSDACVDAMQTDVFRPILSAADGDLVASWQSFAIQLFFFFCLKSGG